MLQLMELSKDFAGKPLLCSVSWHLRKGERVGLVGENGAGKSTLMKMIAGLDAPSSGTIQLAKGARVGYLPQDGIVTRGRTLFQEALSALPDLEEMERELTSLEGQLSDPFLTGREHDRVLERYGELQERYRLGGGYSKEATVGSVLNGLGFSPDEWVKECGLFSGGWQMRIALAKLLLNKPEILLLDEPTNHLDIEARNWLEEYLTAYDGSVILVSHDRFFLDVVCSRIAEVWNHTVTDYACNYSTYLQQREERVSALREAKRRQDEEIASLEDFIRRFRYNANKASLVQSRVKQLEKIERIVIPPERKKIRFSFPEPPKSGKIVMELKKVTRRFGEKVVLNRVDLTVEKGEKIALVGHNGAGKSTLMKVLAGGEFQGGERIVGHNVVIDYFAQDQADELDPDKTVHEEIYADAPFDAVPRLRDLLGAFLFSGDDIQKRCGVLSGGERNRLALAKMLLRPANLLLMDEPTNHLDLFSKEVLLDALRRFPGTVLFVSHDRHFIDNLATSVVEVEGGALTRYHGDYEYYLRKKSGIDPLPSHSELRQESKPASTATPTPEPRRRGREEEKQRQRQERQRRQQLETIEREIGNLEVEQKLLEEVMNEPGFFADPQQAAAATTRHGEIAQTLVDLYRRWEELATLSA
ncbi:MAG: ABC-F family ATP-binding cassette domain-containing protein [Desulfuromonadia bacterium]